MLQCPDCHHGGATCFDKTPKAYPGPTEREMADQWRSIIGLFQSEKAQMKRLGPSTIGTARLDALIIPPPARHSGLPTHAYTHTRDFG